MNVFPSLKLVLVALLALCIVCRCEAKRPRRGAAEPIHANNPKIRAVTLQNFREAVLDPTIPVAVVMYKTDDATSTKTISETVETASVEMEDFVEFLYLDGLSDDGKQLTQMFGVSSLPAIVLFNPELVPVPGGQEGQLMKQPLGYEGDGSSNSLIRFLMQSVTLNHIERLKDDHDVADFFAKFANLDLPRFIYFTDKPFTSPAIIAVSHYYRYGAVFGVAFANNSAEVQARYQVRSFPSLIALLPAGSDGDEVIFMDGLSPDTKLEDLKAFCGQYALPFEKQASLRPAIYMEEEKLRQKEKEHAKMVNALPPIVIRTKKEWVRACLTRKKGMCLAVFLDNVADANIPYDMLFNVSRKVATKSNIPLQIAVIDGLYNHEIAAHFGLTNGLPDAVVFNPEKKKKRTYVNLIGSVTERGLTNFFLDKAVKGIGAKQYKARSVPKFVKTPTAAEEDEISDEL